jgi:hypothetical protein
MKQTQFLIPSAALIAHVLMGIPWSQEMRFSAAVTHFYVWSAENNFFITVMELASLFQNYEYTYFRFSSFIQS